MHLNIREIKWVLKIKGNELKKKITFSDDFYYSFKLFSKTQFSGVFEKLLWKINSIFMF